VNLDRLLEIARDLPVVVSREVPGQVIKAGKANRKHQGPECFDCVN
jgi:hypothetical protein